MLIVNHFHSHQQKDRVMAIGYVYQQSPKTYYNFASLNLVLSVLRPSSSCSATVKSGNFAGMILLGEVPATTEYFPKSVIPACLRRKSSSRVRRPLTTFGGACSIANMASEKIVALRRSFSLSGS